MLGDIKFSDKSLGTRHNVALRVLDATTHEVISEHVQYNVNNLGHNAATNSMLTGIGHYLKGDGILNQGYSMLSNYIPRYISLGTMGLINQDEDEEGLPAGIGVVDGTEEQRFIDYMTQCPGFGADGYDSNLNNGRKLDGLGPVFAERETSATINCELISDSFPRASITYRDVVPEVEAELPKTIDVIFSAMISTGALAQFREKVADASGQTVDKHPYIFITEAGLWSRPAWTDGGDNGLLAGYRVAPPNFENWDMKNPENRKILKQNIIKVGPNQVVQVIWKIQLGAIEQFGGLEELYPTDSSLYWVKWY